MNPLETTIAAIGPLDEAAQRAAAAILDDKTKPRGSLGRLEELAVRIAGMRGTARPARGTPAIVVMGGDHGVAREGVSAYPQEVTAQMLANFARGGAAINVLARGIGARVEVVDMGVIGAPRDPAIRSEPIAAGTGNIAEGPAMSRAQARRALEVGIRIAGELADAGVTAIGTGDMGIANTTPSSALASVFTGLPAAEVTGRGTGIDDDAWQRKVAVIERALAVNRPDPGDPLGVLASLGGFEIAGLAGLAIGAAARRLPVVCDGFISSAAVLTACKLAPALPPYVICAHKSVEAGHRAVLAAIGHQPLLDLDLRLGEGTGAALALQLVDSALAIVHDMASFGDARVTDSGA